MNKNPILFMCLPLLLLGSCAENSTEPLSFNSSSLEESLLSESESSSEEIMTSESTIDFSSLNYEDDLLWFPDLKLEVGQKEFLDPWLLEFENSQILIGDESKLLFENSYLTALKEGNTFIVYAAEGRYKRVNVEIAPKGTYKRAFNFDTADLKDKIICNFGDSVTCDWTVGDEVSEWPHRFCDHYKMKACNNWAIGGSTSIYPVFNTNITKEYKGTPFEDEYDGVDMVYSKYKSGELANVDVMFLTYGYNDLYFQPDIDAEGDDIYCVDDTFACCHSFKGCFRFMINVARLANPNIKIVLTNMIYNEYDIDHNGYTHNPRYSFDKGIKYFDFRKAVFELGYEMDVKVMEMWNYTKTIFDYSLTRPTPEQNPVAATKYVYKDNVHPSIYGNKLIAKYIYKF